MPSGINTTDNRVAIKAKVYSEMLRTVLEPQLLFISNWVDEITDFPDGDTFEDLMMGSATVRDYKEGEQIRYDGLDIGTRDFQLNQYITSGHRVTKKFAMDSFLAAQVMSKLAGIEATAIMTDVETKLLKMHRTIHSTANNMYSIEGFNHRFVAGYSPVEAQLEYGVPNFDDFNYASMALTKCKYTGPMIAIISPYVAYRMSSGKFVKNQLIYQPMFGQLMTTPAVTGAKFVWNFAGVDVYVSNFVDSITDNLTVKSREAAEETSLTRVGSADACIMFVNQPDRRPIRIAWRQRPYFEGRWDMDTQSELYSTIAYYGIGTGDTDNFITMICANPNTTSFTAA